jgi:hypothetical protein
LLIKLIPEADGILNNNWEKKEKQSVFPEDKGLLKIVKNILNSFLKIFFFYPNFLKNSQQPLSNS